MKQFNLYFGVIALIIIGLFYWYSYRPSNIRKECYNTAVLAANFEYEECKKKYNPIFCSKRTVQLYQECLITKGLTPTAHDKW